MSSPEQQTSSQTPDVSIVIPTFNHAKFLAAALQSIKIQSFQNWEAIIVNNFSTDETLQIIASFNEPRFRVINFQNNGVIAASRNEGTRHSKASFIAFLDSDDIWYVDKLDQCIGELQKGNDVVCHGEKWVSANSRSRDIVYGPSSNATHDNLLYGGNCLSTSATVVRKTILETVGGFSEDPRFTTAEDYELWMKIAKVTNKFVFIREILGEYRRHELGASSAVERHLTAELAVVNHHILLSDKKDFLSFKARNRKAKALYSAGRTCMRTNNYSRASGFFLKAIIKSPFLIRSYVALTLTAIRWSVKR